MKIISIVVLFFATVFAVTGQATKPHASEGMKALSFLEGNWQGKVRYEPGANQYHEVSWTANVHFNAGGNFLIIDEKGSELQNRNITTAEVLVVVYWDSAANIYPARLYWSSKDGAGSVELSGYVQDKKIVLVSKEPGSVNRFTVKLNEKGHWYEIGEISNDGGDSWKRRFEMTLNRQD